MFLHSPQAQQIKITILDLPCFRGQHNHTPKHLYGFTEIKNTPEEINFKEEIKAPNDHCKSPANPSLPALLILQETQDSLLPSFQFIYFCFK